MKTTDYEKFSFVNTNRKIQPGLVQRLKDSFNKIGYVEARPVLVNEKFEILDGQNRFTACKEMGLPIIYTVVPANGHSNEIIALLNQNQAAWHITDFIHHYAERGVKFHATVREFEAKYKLGISNSIIVCSVSRIGGTESKKLRAGKNMPLNPNRNEAAEYLISLNELPFYKGVYFVRGIRDFFDKTNEADRDKLFKKRSLISQQPSTAHYLNHFANIINRNRPVNKRIVL